jgi:hypothetical protein
LHVEDVGLPIVSASFRLLAPAVTNEELRDD